MTAQRVLVTGASGFLGTPLVAHLADRFVVRAASRNPIAHAAHVEAARLPDLDREVDWTPLVDGVDIVIHLAAIAHTGAGVPDDVYDRVNHRAAASLAQAAAKSGVSRFVFLSSVRAQTGGSAGHIVSERDTPHPTDAYGRAKLAAEEAVRAAGVPFTILRPVLVYGDGVKGNMATLLRLAALPIPLPFGAFANRRSLLSRDNLFSAIDLAIAAPQSENETFLVADPDPLSVAALVAALRRGMGRHAGLIAVPPSLLKACLAAVGRGAMWPQLAGEQVVDPARLMAAGWSPQPSAVEALGAAYARRR